MTFYSGSEAVAYIGTEAFRRKWLALLDACPWGTACQHPDFVLPWYTLYQADYVPVVVLQEEEDDTLVGLLTMAFFKNGKLLVGAGERQAEYQGWLAKQGDDTFIHDALCMMRKHYPGVDLSLRYLPAGIPLERILHHREYAKTCSVRRHARPIMKVEEPAMSNQRRKKNNRQNFNRLSRMGDVQFTRITEHDRFIQLLDEIITQYDFRQEAMHAVTPFAGDPKKKPFYLELHKRGLLHVSVLTVGGNLAASHCGLLSQGRVLHLGISSFAPTLAVHSPGQLLLAMLGVQLVQENVPVFDLTPGGDDYKTRFATDYDEVLELMIYGSVDIRLKREAFMSAKKIAKEVLQKAGLSTTDARAAVTKMARLKEIGLRGWLESMRQKDTSPPRLYRHCAGLPPNRGRLTVSRNCLKDMFRFDSHGSRVTRWEFLNKAMSQMERSNHLYSFRKDEKLLLCCWAGAPSTTPVQEVSEKEAGLGDDAIVLYDLYIHHAFKDAALVQRFIEQILHDLKGGQGKPDVYFHGSLNEELQTILRQCGFVDDVARAGLFAGPA
jgi:CelD/BcsL family acetyltransferase involved in cellulose biosynthesis